MSIIFELSGQELVVNNSGFAYEENTEQPNDAAEGFEQYSETKMKERTDQIVDQGADFVVSALLVGAGAFAIKRYAKNHKR